MSRFVVLAAVALAFAPHPPVLPTAAPVESDEPEVTNVGLDPDELGLDWSLDVAPTGLVPPVPEEVPRTDPLCVQTSPAPREPGENRPAEGP